MVNLAYRGEWNQNVTYAKWDLVRYPQDNDWYVCLNNSTNGSKKHPHNSRYWNRATMAVAESAEITHDACEQISISISSKESKAQNALQGVSTTAAGTATKTVSSVPNGLAPGTVLGVSFQNANTASSPKLKLGSETYTVDLGTHEETEIKGYCLFVLTRPNNVLKARFLGGDYT